MKELNFRPLKANEIECRVGNVGKDNNGFYLLLYKNARVDQCILDECVGQFGWQCKYYQVKNTMVCSVGIYSDEHQSWLWKDNGGDDDYQAEQVKAELSDAFKRACFNWGIGRELYYAPKIWIDATDKNTTKSRYSVKTIEYGENKRITNLAIINDKTKEVVFYYGKEQKVAEKAEKEPKKAETNRFQDVDNIKGSIEPEDLKYIQDYIALLHREESRTRVYNWLDENFKTMNPEMLTKNQGKSVVATLKGDKQ